MTDKEINIVDYLNFRKELMFEYTNKSDSDIRPNIHKVIEYLVYIENEEFSIEKIKEDAKKNVEESKKIIQDAKISASRIIKEAKREAAQIKKQAIQDKNHILFLVGGVKNLIEAKDKLEKEQILPK